ncbi:spermatogenesis-associated protein 7 isoform X2 [Ranitomeya imitator]|uniref:spermatogenesis-associated protein 7 isoform X2 n=1 Tax=Ranitomeya imitator TaxID=111125 RepID=UPI0037E75505
MSPGYRAAPEDAGRATNPGARAGSRVPSIPRCGVSSPFRGHLSTKSNAFCIGQSSRLSDQYQIRDHMVIHYNKILSAKAAVDCSVPKSLIKSVKHSDQRRRERMKKEVAQLERTSSHSAASSRPCSRDSTDSIILRKDYNDPHSHPRRHSPYSDPGPIYTPLPLQSPGHTGKLHDWHPECYRLHSGLSHATAWTSPCKFQDNQSKTYSGDLLEKHSHHFTTKERPFTPRTLKTQAKSALAQSRYYTPPRRKTRRTASETQTDISSFRHVLRTPESDSSPIRDLESHDENLLLSDEDLLEERLQRSLSSELKSSAIRKIHSEEEELSYLKFVADVTNEILTLGLFSDRVVERLFQRHLEENRHRLDEGKMRHLLDVLRSDLDCREETNLQSVVRNPHSKRSLTNSSWDEVMSKSSQEEAASDDLHGLVSDNHLLVDSAPYQEEDDVHSDVGARDAEHGDCATLGADETDGDHHQEDDGGDHHHHQEDDGGDHHHQEDDGDDHHHQENDGDDHHHQDDDGGDDHHHQEDDGSDHHHQENDGGDRLSPDHDGCDVQETAADDRTDQPSNDTFTSPSTPISNSGDDVETLEELQQTFADVIQVSRGNDCDVSDPGDADEMNDCTEF